MLIYTDVCPLELWQEMCLGVYESFVNLNPCHVDHFLHTADLEGRVGAPGLWPPWAICSLQWLIRGVVGNQLVDIVDQIRFIYQPFDAN